MGAGGGEVREGEIRGGRRCGAMASERDSVNAREGWKGRGGEERSGGRREGGGLAAAVTSSFMNSLYFCSVQNKRTFLLKKMKKRKKQRTTIRFVYFFRTFVFSSVQVPSKSPAFQMNCDHRGLHRG